MVTGIAWQSTTTGIVDKTVVYRIGYGNDVPFHFKEDDGEPAGLAYDLVNAGALRAGIKLEWIESEGFDQDKLDFWVLMTILPDRKDAVYFTAPFLQTRTCFLVPEGSPFRNPSDFAKAHISHANYGVHIENLARYLPECETSPTESSRDAVLTMLNGDSDAVYLDQYAALRSVLEGQLSTSVRVIDSQFPPLEMALASTFEASAVADRIREGMTSLGRDGSINDVTSRWDLFPNLTDNLVGGLVAAERRIKILAAALVVIGLALALSLWLAIRLRRQTDRLKKAQQSLRQSAEQYRTIVENTHDLVYTVDTQGIIKFLGPQATRYGIDPKKAVSKNMLEFVLPEDRERVAEELEDTIATDNEHTTELRIPGIGDSPVWLEERGSLVRDEQGNIVEITGALRDITDRKRTEEALTASEAKYRTFFENSCDPMLILNDGVFVDCNFATLAILGHQNKNDILGRPPADLSPILQPDGSASKERITKFIESSYSKGSQRFEWEYKTKDGSQIPVDVSMTALPSQGKQVFLCVWRDISDRKQAETEQKKLERQLRHSQKMEAIGLLAGGIAHDFNNILAAMTMNLDLLKEESGLNQTLTVGLADLTLACSRAADLTRQLLTFSRRSVLEVKSVDLAEVVNKTLDMIKRLLGEDITIEFQNEHSSLPSIEADTGALEQILMNLCVNARDAMPNGGNITIKTDITQRDHQSAQAPPGAKNGPYVRLTFTDTGCGMDTETLKQIFDPFFTTKDVGKGTGLGLASVQGSIAQHGGWIEVTSNLGMGTSFELYFPASLSLAKKNEDTLEADTSKGSETILVVEDEPSVRSVLRRALTRLGYQVLEASCGQDAIDHWQEHQTSIKLLLTDVVLPGGMTGIQLAETLRKTAPHLRVIVSSGYNNETASPNSDSHLQMGYLPKPYTIGDLARIVRETLDNP